jgi:hypothetical protein
VNLRIDPDLLRSDRDFRTDRPNTFISQHNVEEATFGWFSDNPNTGPRCRRCNDLLHIHLWQLVDGTDIVDCGRRP